MHAESPFDPATLASEPPLSPLPTGREEPLLAPVADELAEPVQVPALEPVPVPALEPEPEPQPLPPAALVRVLYRISLTLDTGDRLEVAAHEDEASARAEATDLMRYLHDGRGDWPFVAGRFVRPERIVSVDVEAS